MQASILSQLSYGHLRSALRLPEMNTTAVPLRTPTSANENRTYQPARRILALCLGGIGDTVLSFAGLRDLRRAYRDDRITAIAMWPQSAELLTDLGIFDEVLQHNFQRDRLWKSLWMAWKLRRRKCDVSILAFPANRFEYNAMSFLLGGRQRFGHSYIRGGDFENLRFLLTDKIAQIAVDYLYDSNNRLTQREKDSATENIEKYVYDSLGRLVTAKKGTSGDDDAVSQSIFSYDNLGRVTNENQSILGGTAKSVAYTFDVAGRKISMLHHGGGVTATYGYDSRDRCTQIAHNGSTLADYTWLGNAISKRETTCDYPGSTKPKFKSDYQRDGILRVSKMVNEHTTLDQAGSTYGDLGTWDYAYDSAANELSGVASGSMGVYLRAHRYYVYDTAHRLVTSRYNEETGWPETGPPSSQQTSWYTYDDLGNRISHKYRSSGAIGYAHDKANRMTTLANRTQGYDLAGNLTLAYSADRNTSYTYRWDHHNRLTGVYDSTNTTRKAAFAYDALGRRIEFINDKLGTTNRYYYDGVNEIVEDNQSASRQKYYIHGVSYVDERLMMYHDGNSRPYYYVLDRMYNVRAMVDRAGAIVEVYRYDGYGRPKIRESCGRGDMDNDSRMNAANDTRFDSALAASIWDPRADLDDDGDVDTDDEELYDAKKPDWNGSLGEGPTVDQAFSDLDNWYMFQGVPHLALDNLASDTAGKLMLNHHRARYADPVTGRWNSRDPLNYNRPELAPRPINVLYLAFDDTPTKHWDPHGTCTGSCAVMGTPRWGPKQVRAISPADPTACTCDYSTVGAWCSIGCTCRIWFCPWRTYMMSCAYMPNTASTPGLITPGCSEPDPRDCCDCPPPSGPPGGACAPCP